MTSAPQMTSAEDVTHVQVEMPSLDEVPFRARLKEVAVAFLPMGFIAFGGPQAHIALFLKTFVEGKRKWLDEQRFMELMSLGQAMPGPTSTQMATAMGISRAGALGGVVAFWLFDWVGFMVQLAVGTAVHHFAESASEEALDTYKMLLCGMGPAAISQVFIAAYTLGLKAVGKDHVKIMLALVTCCVALLVDTASVAAYVFLGCMLIGGLVTMIDARRPSRREAYAAALKPPSDQGVLKRMGIPRCVGVALVVLTLGLFAMTQIFIWLPSGSFGGGKYGADAYVTIFASLYKMGISIYGGGQVVLPMLEAEFVGRSGYPTDRVGGSLGAQPMDAETFGFGLALAQSLPGPLFNFSAFLGAAVASVGFGGRQQTHPIPTPRPLPRLLPARASSLVPLIKCYACVVCARPGGRRHPRFPGALWAWRAAHLRVHALLGGCAQARVGALHAGRHERRVHRPRLLRLRYPLLQVLSQLGRGCNDDGRDGARPPLQATAACCHLWVCRALPLPLPPRRPWHLRHLVSCAALWHL